MLSASSASVDAFISSYLESRGLTYNSSTDVQRIGLDNGCTIYLEVGETALVYSLVAAEQIFDEQVKQFLNLASPEYNHGDHPFRCSLTHRAEPVVSIVIAFHALEEDTLEWAESRVKKVLERVVSGSAF